MVLPLIPLMGKRTFQTFLQVLVVRSVALKSLIVIHPILSYIDTRQLLFLQKLCSLDDNFLTKRIFMTWLFSYFADNSRKHFGFVPDIIGILYHYELSDYLVEYLLQGIFPPKQ
jgi:hypothetical protein